MAEDQPINGDIWTNQAVKLFVQLGWEIVGDQNIDIKDNNGKAVGIDSLLRFEDGFKPNRFQGVFFEAKRYKESTFKSNSSDLQKWIKTLDDKLSRLKRSSDLLENYPALENATINTGVIGIWIYDCNNLEKFKSYFLEKLSKIENLGRASKKQPNKILVITNDKILELISLHQTLKELAEEEKVCVKEIKFFYPSSLQLGSGVNETHILNFNYMFSKFIFSKLTRLNKADLYIVFYFGEIDIHSFKRLIEAMSLYNFLHTQDELIIYTYKRNDEFRKTKPQVIKEFERKDVKNVKIKSMNVFQDLPNWITD